MTLVCVPITVTDPASADADAAAAKAAGADLVEFRVDDFFTGEAEQITAIVRLVSESALPCILTCRAAPEGGAYGGDDEARAALIERLCDASRPGEHPPRYIDVELAAYERSPGLRQRVDLAVHPSPRRHLTSSLILSLHDFTTRPADLLRRVARMAAEPAAAVIKVASRARSLRDSIELLDLAAHAARPTIALGIGEFGLLSRVLAPKFNAFLTFASLRRESATAPGQPTLHDLLHLYRFRSITPATRVYGVVGWPVWHSFSPAVHNAGFEAAGCDAVYLPLPVASGDDADASYASFKATLLELIEHPRLNLRGCSVTLPHKENLVRLARERGWAMDDASGAVNAANTLTVERGDGGDVIRVRVTNTDAPALLACLRDAMRSISGKTVLMLGAGGVARAGAWACAREGARVRIHSRTAAKSVALAAHLASLGLPPARAVGKPEAASLADVDAVIHCTPQGMKGAEPGSPLPADLLAALPPTAVVFDTVYIPRRTELIAHAETRGLSTIDGLRMFVHQAAAQFERWTGNPAPLNLFQRVAEEGGA